MRTPLLLLAIVSLNAILAAGHDHGHGHGHGHGHKHPVRFNLHRRRPRADMSHIDHLQTLTKIDRARHNVITMNVARNTGDANNSTFVMPVIPGSYRASGQYFVRLRIGTPAQKFVLVPDTGSEVTWMSCHYEPRCPKCRRNAAGGPRIFEAMASKTFRPVGCTSDMCQLELPNAITECVPLDSFCNYTYSYLDGSIGKGFFATESATVSLPGGGKTKLPGLVMGCTLTSTGVTTNYLDGILGLGYGDSTFAGHATKVYGGRFSYCLVDIFSPPNITNYLVFGPNRAFSSPQRTPLIVGEVCRPYYGVIVEGISVGGEILPIPMSVWNLTQRGGMIIDSGTTATIFTSPVYDAVVTAIVSRLIGVERVHRKEFEHCYKWSDEKRMDEVPELVVHFAGSARLQPPVKSYMIPFGDRIKCIGFARGDWPGLSILGNIMQQEHLWEFDLKNQQLRFESSKCGQR